MLSPLERESLVLCNSQQSLTSIKIDEEREHIVHQYSECLIDVLARSILENVSLVDQLPLHRALYKFSMPSCHVSCSWRLQNLHQCHRHISSHPIEEFRCPPSLLARKVARRSSLPPYHLHALAVIGLIVIFSCAWPQDLYPKLIGPACLLPRSPLVSSACSLAHSFTIVAATQFQLHNRKLSLTATNSCRYTRNPTSSTFNVDNWSVQGCFIAALSIFHSRFSLSFLFADALL